MGAGASAYVQKRHMKHQLVPAIQAALAGQFYVSQRDPSLSLRNSTDNFCSDLIH
jgi:DNA-binding NarL/FixJ family response regulator